MIYEAQLRTKISSSRVQSDLVTFSEIRPILTLGHSDIKLRVTMDNYRKMSKYSDPWHLATIR
jgi:hypothetical protein